MKYKSPFCAYPAAEGDPADPVYYSIFSQPLCLALNFFAGRLYRLFFGLFFLCFDDVP